MEIRVPGQCPHSRGTRKIFFIIHHQIHHQIHQIFLQVPFVPSTLWIPFAPNKLSYTRKAMPAFQLKYNFDHTHICYGHEHNNNNNNIHLNIALNYVNIQSAVQ